MIKFTAETKCSGVDLQDGTQIRKGAFDAIRRIVESAGNKFPKEVEESDCRHFGQWRYPAGSVCQ